MPEQLCNRPQIHPGHNKSTGKRMAVAMSGILMNLRLFESSREPSARPLQGSAHRETEHPARRMPNRYAPQAGKQVQVLVGRDVLVRGAEQQGYG